MKRKTILLIGILAAVFCVKTYGYHEIDTVIIEFGDNSRVVIYVDSKEDLKALESYDFNEILRDLNNSLETNENKKYLVIEDESGERYLKDITDREQKDEKEDFESKFKCFGNELGDNDKKTDFSEKKTRSFSNVEIGTSNWMQNGNFANDELAIKPWGSWYVSLSEAIKTSLGGPLFVEWGPSLNWYNWKFEDAGTRITHNGSNLAFNSAAKEDGVQFVKSKLTAGYFNFSLVPMLDFSYGRKTITKDEMTKRITSKVRNGIRLGIGGYAGLRLGSKTKYVTKSDEKDKAKDRGNFNLNDFRYGIRAQLGYRDADFFVNYDLNQVFEENRGPKLNGFSFGFIL